MGLLSGSKTNARRQRDGGVRDGGCRLCGSAQTRRLFIKEAVPYYHCTDCGLCSGWPEGNPNIDRDLEDYEAAYLQYLDSNAADCANHRAMLSWVRSVARLDLARVVDVGCGSGKWVRALRAANINAIGLEPSRALYHRFLEREPDVFIEGTVEEFSQENAGKFDVVTAFDVLEHVPVPKSFLNAAVALLRPEGLLLLSTPDQSSAPARLMGKHWHHYNDCHLSLFSKETLSSTLEQMALRPLQITYRAKHFPLGYMFRYAYEFVLGAHLSQLSRSSWIDSLTVPLNTHDTVYVCAQRTALSSR